MVAEGETEITLMHGKGKANLSQLVLIDYRGRAAPSAPRTSCLAWNAGLEGPLFHGAARSIEGRNKIILRGSEYS